MPDYLSEVIMWTCGIAFVVCMIAGLLIVAGIWEPKDPAVRKWLLRVVVFSVVGAVAGFAVRQFSWGDGGNSEPQLDSSEQTSPKFSDRQPGDTSGSGPRETVPPVDHLTKEPAPTVPTVPDGVATWALDALGTRPVFNNPPVYPGCIQTLRNQDSVSRKEARSCRNDLEQMHLNVIVEFYDLKRAYDSRLEHQEAKLRERGISQKELPRYNYIVSEMERLNGDGSREIASLHQLEEKLLRDIRACRQSLCQSVG